MADSGLNYSDCETLRPKLVPRCIEAVRKYLLYLDGAGTDAQKAWVKDNMDNLASWGERMSHYCLSEPGFLGTITRGATPDLDTWSGGTSISDAALQARIENVLNAHFIPSA